MTILKLLRSIVRKSLLACGYPKLETSHPELGTYEVGAIKVRMGPGTPASQIFYPVGTDSKRTSNEFVPYFRKEAVDGLLDFLHGFGDGTMQMLEEKSHPLIETYGVDPWGSDVDKTCKEREKFPLVLFSHGLGGNMEMYTEICAQLASTGFVVVAVEHEDGSASHSTRLLEDGRSETVSYSQPLPNSKVPYSRKKVLDFRTPMLEQRVDELRRIYDYFCGNTISSKGAVTETESTIEHEKSLLEKILTITDPKTMHLVGHSFGGATQLLAAQKWIIERSSETLSNELYSIADKSINHSTSGETSVLVADKTLSASPPLPISVTVFDAWNFALSDQVLSTGLPVAVKCSNDQSIAVPTVTSILSEDWVKTNSETEQTLEFLRNCPPETTFSYVAKHSVHQSASDSEAYLPSMISQRIGNRGPQEERHHTIRAMVKVFVERATSEGDRKFESLSSKEDENDVLIPLPLQ